MYYLIPLIIFFILYAIIAWKDLVLAISILTFLLPAYLIRFLIGPIPSTALEGMVVIVFIVWLIKQIRKSRLSTSLSRVISSKFFWPGFALVVASGLTLFWVSDIRAGLGIWKAYFIEPFLVYIVLIDVIQNRKDWYKIFISLGVLSITLTIVAIIQRVTGWWSPTWEWTLPETRRVTGFFTSPNALGLLVAPITALYLGWFFIKEKRSSLLKVFKVVVVLAGVLSLLLAVSKGAMLALLAALFVLLFIQWSKKWTVIAGVVAIVGVLIVPSLRGQIVPLITFQNASGQSRVALYEGSLDLIKQHAVKGTGLSGFASAFEQVRPEGFTEELIYPHNIFLNFWLETGLLGLVVLIWIVLVVVRLGWKHRSNKEGLAFAWLFVLALVPMFVHGVVDVPYFKNDLAMLTWLVLAGLAWSDLKGSHEIGRMQS